MLAVLGVVAKLIGVFYRLPLTNILGAEGMGLYQMIFPLYSLLLAVISGGIPAAMAKCVSELRAVGREGELRRLLSLNAAVLIAFGVTVAALLAVFGKGIARLQGNENAGIAYMAIAPAVALSGAIASLRGYFQGLNNMLPSGVSQVAEQAAKVAFGLSLAAAFSTMGVEYSVFGALIGVSLSEVVALIYLAVSYAVKFARRKQALALEAASDVILPPLGAGALLKRMYAVALPVTLGSLVIPLGQALDSFLVINMLTLNGADVTYATSLFGLMNGPVGSLLNLPTVVTAALAASLLPSVSALRSKDKPIDKATNRSISAMLAFVLPCAAVFAIAPEPILRILYSRGLSEAELKVASTLLRIESIDVALLGAIQIFTAIEQGSGKAAVPVVCLTVGAVMKAAANIVLLPVIGIFGAAAGTVVCYGITFALDLICVKKRTDKLIKGTKVAKILLCAVVFASVMSSFFVIRLFTGDIIALFAASIIAFGAYVLAISKTKCILLSEILS